MTCGNTMEDQFCHENQKNGQNINKKIMIMVTQYHDFMRRNGLA